ncbi:MAG: hypothetical protein ACRD2J_12890 [Thermoanaerobaculia bacterium]
MAAIRVPRPLRAALCFGAALAAWILFGDACHRALGSAAGVVVAGGGIFVEPGSEALLAWPTDRPDARVRVPLTAVTSNLVLLATLWGWTGPRRATGYVWGLLVVIAGQLLAVVSGIHATLALGPGGETEYGVLATNLWFIAWQGYQIIGAWAIAFGAWWIWGGGEKAGG